MIKKLLIILLLLTTGVKPQSYMNFESMKLYDSYMIGFLKTINKEMGAERVIVFQTVMKGVEKKTDLVTFILADFKNRVVVRMVSSNFVYSTIELKKSKIFDPKYISGTGVTSNEDKLKDVPGILDPTKGSDVVMYFGQNKFFFETGNIINSVEDKSKSRLRNEWVSLIKSELQVIMKDFRKETLYSRRNNGSTVQIAKSK